MANDYDAVLVVAFGGPEKPEDVMPFIEGVVRGRDVPRERMLAAARRYEHIGGKSPNNDQCRRLVQALEAELANLGPKLSVYWGNRNWRPYLVDTIRRMADDGVRRAAAFLTSPYSSYSSCRQYLEAIGQARAEVGDRAPRIDKLRGYFNHPGFVEPIVQCVGAALGGIPAERRAAAGLVFTAHSLPLAMAKQCDYEAQLAEVARLVAGALGENHWALTYQSRSGPSGQPWLEPDVRDYMRSLDPQRTRDVVVAPIGFIWDHMEVVYDLDVELQQVCDGLGVNMIRAATPGTHPRFVAMIRQLVAERTGDSPDRPALGGLGPASDACPANCCPAPQRPVR